MRSLKGDWDVRAVHGVDEEKVVSYLLRTAQSNLRNDSTASNSTAKRDETFDRRKGTHMVRWNKTTSRTIDAGRGMTQTPKTSFVHRCRCKLNRG